PRWMRPGKSSRSSCVDDDQTGLRVSAAGLDVPNLLCRRWSVARVVKGPAGNGDGDFLPVLDRSLVLNEAHGRLERASVMRFYVSINPWGVFVKEADFFRDQGGLDEEWGQSWIGPVEASSIEEARRWGLEERTKDEISPGHLKK